MFWILLVACAAIQVLGGGTRPGFGGTEQDWGTEEISDGVFMFWWLYFVDPPERPEDFDVYSRPLIVWLDGGPGDGSSGYGNFFQIGPLDIDGVTPRNTSWVKDYNILFIDAPVGAGFSYVSDASKYRSEDDDTVSDIIGCLTTVLEKHEEFRTVPMYIVGHSYGAKLAVKVAQLLLQNAESPPNELKGVALSSPFISPRDAVLSIGAYHHKLGFLDTFEKLVIEELGNEFNEKLIKQNWMGAFASALGIWQKLVNYTKFWNLENISVKSRPKVQSVVNQTQVTEFMNTAVKRILGVTSNFGDNCSAVYFSSQHSFYKSAVSSVKTLVEEARIKVVVFTGQMDGLVSPTSTEAWVNKIFTNDAQWRHVPKTPLLMDGVIDGYEKHYKLFSMYWILRAGHLVTRDNPKSVEVVLKRLISP